MMKTVAVIGGGASGMLAALAAAESGTQRVLLFERQARVGRKLMATGNGRCNFTNTGASVADYHGEDPSFVRPILEKLPPKKIMAIFAELGLLCVEQYGGRVYPLSDSAGSVLDVLRFAMQSAGIELHAAEPILSIHHKKDLFSIRSEIAEYTSDYVIIACGGKAGGKIGGVGDGYDLLRSLGHHCSKLYPALVPIKTDSDYPRSLKGIRADAKVSLYSGDHLLAVGEGELQFTENGISGPAAFDISREASVNGGRVCIDFLRGRDEAAVEEMLLLRKTLSPELENSNIFAGILQSRLGLTVVRYSGLRPSETIGNISRKQIRELAQSAKNFEMNVKGTDSFDNAQVTAGGIRTKEFDPETLESRIVKNLFACGEVLDIDGDCGGYNLQWAWASGYTAGRLGK